MADEMDPCLWKRKKKKQTHEHSSESDDEPYGFVAKNQTKNSTTSKDQRTNDSNRNTGVSLVYAPGKIPDPGIFPYYCHKEPIRGSAIFVVNQSFQSYPYRYGAEKDMLYLKSVFLDKLGFEQLNKGDDFNLKLSKLDDVLEKTIAKDYSDTDFFVFAISTHGEERPRRSQKFEHALLCADDQYKFTMDVINSFGRCPTLAGKPKIFVIQACRSRFGSKKNDPNKFDKGLEFTLMSKKEERGSKPKSKDSADADNKTDANSEVDINEANIVDKKGTKTDEKDQSYAKASERDKANEKDNKDADASTKDEADARHKNDIFSSTDSADADDKTDANSEVDIKEANIEDTEGTKTDEKDETYAKASERDKANENDNKDADASTKDEADAGHKNDDYQKRAESGFGSENVISLINIQNDCLVVYAIQSGKYAWRNSETGSWLLYELNNAMEEHTSHSRIHFLDILTKTAFKMAQRKTSGGFKAVSVIHHRLTKDLLFPLKHGQT